MQCIYFQVPDSRTLGDDVTVLEVLGPKSEQAKLAVELGLKPNAKVSELFAKLSAFQSNKGIVLDGSAGAFTWQLLRQSKLEKKAKKSKAVSASVPIKTKSNIALSWSDIISAEVLAKIFPYTRTKNLQLYAPYVFAALDSAGFGPNTPDGKLICKVALATIRAESEGFEPIAEMRSRFNSSINKPDFDLYEPKFDLKTRKIIPDENATYQKLGNTQFGDGANFKGRGFIQLTGRYNYTHIGKQLKLELNIRPYLANMPEIASAILVQFLKNKQINIIKNINNNNFVTVRKLVNGGSHGLDRFEKACELWTKHIEPLLKLIGSDKKSLLHAKQKFNYAKFFSKDSRFSLPVKSDPVDLRDLPYRPPLGSLPNFFPPKEYVSKYWPSYENFVLDQGQEGACTGFGLACMVNYLKFTQKLSEHLSSSKTKFDTKKISKVSPRMIYEFARRYDEFTGNDYEGSSCRGALKGWHKHGVCDELAWPYADLVPADPKWATNALHNTLGVYYRIDKSNLVDMQAAIADVGAIFVSGSVHSGWELKRINQKPSHEALPHIQFNRQLKITGAHAFAIVGYNSSGFVVQNSWGLDWGLSGFGILTYADWLANGMDAWVGTLGVPGVVNNAAAMSGMVVTSRKAGVSGEDVSFAATQPADYGIAHSLVLDQGKPCNLPTEDALGGLSTFATEWPNKWFKKNLKPDEPRRVVLYAHGGLNSEKDGVLRAGLMAKAFLDNGCYPIFLVWKTGPLETLKNIIKGWFGLETKVAGGVVDFTDDVLERTVGATVARKMWNSMKDSAVRANVSEGGLTQLTKALQALLSLEPKLEVHLVGHSAGSLLLGPMISTLAKHRVPVVSAHLFAPACTIEFANKYWLPSVGAKDTHKGTFPLTIYVLSNELELDDSVYIYRKSLLYFVARGIEEKYPAPLLGMEGAWDRTKLFEQWNGDAETQESIKNLERSRQELKNYLELKVIRTQNIGTVTDKAGNLTSKDAAGNLIPDNNVTAAHGTFDADAKVILATLEGILGVPPSYKELNLSKVP
jgi:predicted chitinase